MVFQSFNLFDNMTVLDNCMVGQTKVLKRNREEAKRNALRYLEKVGMAPYIHARPRQLSGGQKQRVAIARALIKDAPIIILDEATSSLDNESESVVQQAMYNLMQNKTVIIIAHRLSTIRNANHILVLDNGQIAERGTHESLMQLGGEYAKLYKAQFDQISI